MGHYFQGEHGRAASRLARVAARTDVDDNWLLGPAELTLGKMADLRGEREQARALYRRAEGREDVWGSRDEARRLQVKPFDGREPGTRPKDDEQRYPERP